MTQSEPLPLWKRHKSDASARTPISTFVSVPRHPLGLKPSGNTLLLDAKEVSKSRNLGRLSRFDDELILLLLSYVRSTKDLLRVSHTSRELYTYTYHDEIWKNLYFANGLKIDRWLGSWRKTILNIQSEALIPLEIYSDQLYRPYQCSFVDYTKIFKKLLQEEEILSITGKTDDKTGYIRRIPEPEMTLDSFNTEWIGKPFILTNINQKERWPLKFNIEYLAENYKDETMRQEAVRWPIDLYFQYLKNNRDENPLYLFDPTNKIVQDLKFDLPAVFEQDLFKIFEACRPDHKWIIIGPARSGSTFHKDPNTTSAWNTVVQGRKIWVMTPPNVIPPGVSTDETEDEVTSPIGLLEWVLSGFFNDALRMSQTGDCLIGVTFPGECLYVPSGWWHTVINVDDSIAITQNFMPLKRLDRVLSFFKNKNDQISGFHPNEVYIEMEKLIEKVSGSETEDFFKLKLQELSKFREEKEDIGELNDIELPIYEIFTALLQLHGYSTELQESLDRLNVKPKENWNSITVQKSSFSFGFEDEE